MCVNLAAICSAAGLRIFSAYRFMLQSKNAPKPLSRTHRCFIAGDYSFLHRRDVLHELHVRLPGHYRLHLVHEGVSLVQSAAGWHSGMLVHSQCHLLCYLITTSWRLGVEGSNVCYACTQQESYLKNYLGCPNAYFPSDHFPLVCEFRLGASDAAK
jgi:hypothetical protein